MREVILGNLELSLTIALFFARLGDIVSTYVATPKLILETNPFVRWLGWPFAIASLAICLVPYADVSVGFLALVLFLMVTGSNLRAAWLIRSLGEAEYFGIIRRAAEKSTLRHALTLIMSSSLCFVLAGVSLWLFYPTPSAGWAWWFGMAVTLYGLATGFYTSLHLRRIFTPAQRDD